MADEAVRVAIPPRGTPALRAWWLRLLATALLPGFAVAMGIMSIRALDLAAAEGAPWGDLAGWFTTGLIAAGILGVVCVFDKRTRVVGFFAIAIAIFVNPITFALTLGAWGLA